MGETRHEKFVMNVKFTTPKQHVNHMQINNDVIFYWALYAFYI